MVSEPFYWPEHNHHNHHDGSDKDEIDTMLKVLEIIRRRLRPETDRAMLVSPSKSDLMSFMRDIKPER